MQTHRHELSDLAHGRKTARLNLNAKAWRRLRQVYADQPVSPVFELQNRFAGVWFSALECLAYGLSKSSGELPGVIFVIGHWRSGTTFLHEMLCADPGFNFPTTYACMNPQVFPITEGAVLHRSGQRSVKRPMDNMSTSLASPQEDEFALLALGAPSPYEGLLFPRVLERGMATADPNDLPASEKQTWIRVFTRFLAQVAGRRPGCPIVVKSPTHSYRVKLLSQLFPNARFIHIVRNPIEVYKSTLNMWKSLCSLYALTDLPDDDTLGRQVIANWIRLEEKLDAALPGLQGEKYVRVFYESLAAHPLEEMKRIYAELKLEGFAAALPHIERHLASRNYVAENLVELAPEKANDVFQAWRHICGKYRYPEPTWQV
jgi:omega-hydroxy-beta-dihydromenaquinone-9 sulfotransferase